MSVVKKLKWKTVHPADVCLRVRGWLECNCCSYLHVYLCMCMNIYMPLFLNSVYERACFLEC